MDLIARKGFSYAGVALRPGDSFDASSRDARVLMALGRADRAAPLTLPPEPAPIAPAPELELDQAEAADAPAPADAPKPRRQYRRRDLTAES